MQTKRELYKKIYELYQNKKMTRNEIAEKYNIDKHRLTLSLRNNNIELWDAKFRRNKKKRRIYSSKFYNPKEYNNHLMFNYNK